MQEGSDPCRPGDACAGSPSGGNEHESDRSWKARRQRGSGGRVGLGFERLWRRWRWWLDQAATGHAFRPAGAATRHPRRRRPRQISRRRTRSSAITNTYPAHEQGFIGTGITIGIVDSGIMRSNPTVAGRVKQGVDLCRSGGNNTTIDDVVGHGTWVSEIAAGTPFDKFAGGIAPGATLVSARILSDIPPKDDGSGQRQSVTAADAAFFGQTLNPALIAAGVQVMNNSWGGIYWDTTDTSINQAFARCLCPLRRAARWPGGIRRGQRFQERSQ